MLVASLHFGANLIIWLVLLRWLQTWIVRRYGDQNAFARAFAFID